MIRGFVMYLMALICLPSAIICCILGLVFRIEYNTKIKIPGR